MAASLSEGSSGSSFWSSSALLAAVALGVVSFTRRPTNPEGSLDRTSCLLLLLLSAATLHLAQGFFLHQNGVASDSAPSSNNHAGEPRKPRLSLTGLVTGTNRNSETVGLFPQTDPLIAAEEDMQWFEEVMSRIYNCDWDPDKPASVPIQRRAGLRATLEAVIAVGPSVAEGADEEPLRVHEPIDYAVAGRALLATDFDATKAQGYASNYLAWRREIGGCTAPPLPWLESAQVLFPFQDRHGRPVIVLRARCHKPRSEQQTMEVLQEGYRATMDAALCHLLKHRGSSISRSNPLEQIVVMLDMQAAGFANFSIQTVKMMQAESTHHYSDLLGKFYVLFPNSVFQFSWKLAQPLLHDRTKRKVQLIPQAEVPGLFDDLVGNRAVVPREYGGEARNWPEPDDCETLEDMAGTLAVAAWRMAGVAPVKESEPTPNCNGRKPSCGPAVPEAWLSCCGSEARRS